MSTFVLLFPGQGSQEPEMAETVAKLRPDLAERVTALVGEDPFARVADGTRFAQPAIFCAALAGLERLGCPDADLYAGHSLGEITALVAAGALSEEGGLQIVAERGRLMDRAAVESPGGMLAVRAERSEAEALAERHDLVVANDNAPRQIVLSGPLAGIEAAEAEASDVDLKAKRLPVAGAFHSPLLEHVVEPFLAALREIEVRRPRAPVYSCVTAAPFDDDPRDCLAKALMSPVRWVEVLHALHAAGGRSFVETGPGKVLSGLVRRTLDDVEVSAPEPAEAAARA
ncbi:MAG TPA: ACP S-malonyltransferase [Thermoleophilaceae bacterium]|nr:ACP S-malonyltransferase [Thermoleophilaceae bacterium]